MAALQAKSRYMAALQDRLSPNRKGRKSPAVTVSSSDDQPPPPPPPPKQKGRVAQRWQAKAQKKYEKEQKQAAIPKPFSMTAPPPPPPSRRNASPTASSASGASSSSIPGSSVSGSSSTQVMNLRKQFDTNKDIRRGKVANSTFGDPPPPPPPQRDRGAVVEEMQHPMDEVDEIVDPISPNSKKQQWDAERDIPKGAVSAWKSPTSGSEAVFPPPLSPGKSSTKPRPDAWQREPDVKASDSPKRQWEPNAEIPLGAVSKLKTNQFWVEGEQQEVKSPQVAQQKKQWDASKDIPRGKVRGMSHLFGGKKVDIPENHLEPVEPAATSPPHSKVAIVRPVAIQASRSEDSNALSSQGGQQQQQQLETPPRRTAVDERVTDFYMDGASEKQGASEQQSGGGRGETDPWVLPSSSSTNQAFFGKGTWGEEANASRSNDEYDERDWFQSGSFNNEEEKKEHQPFQDDGAFNIIPDRDVLFEDSTHNSDEIGDDAVGSFAAAIQPLGRMSMSTPPETVPEEPEEEELQQVVAPQVSPVFQPVVHPIPTARSSPQRAVPPRSPARFSPGATEQESNNNSRKLMQLLESNRNEINSSPKSVGSGSKASRASKGSQRSLFRRNKADKKKEGGGGQSVASKSKVSGLRKLFSKKQVTAGSDEDTVRLRQGDSSNMSPAKKGSRRSPKLAVAMMKPDPKSPKHGSSLTQLTEDVEKVRSKGVISTRDDNTVVSEMTNPTVFLGKTASSEERTDEMELKQIEPKIQVQTSFPPGEDFHADTFSPKSGSFGAAPDPFDVTSPMFSSGDPFQTATMKESTDLNVAPFSSGFDDSFFNEMDEHRSQTSARSGRSGVKSDVASAAAASGASGTTGSVYTDGDDIRQQRSAVSGVGGTISTDGDGKQHVANSRSTDESVQSRQEILAASPEAHVAPTARASSIALTDGLTLDTAGVDMDEPDPDLELLSSDDEAENDDPASSMCSPKSAASSKHEMIDDPLALPESTSRSSGADSIEPSSSHPAAPFDTSRTLNEPPPPPPPASAPLYVARNIPDSPARGMSRRQWKNRSEPTPEDDTNSRRLVATVKPVSRTPKSPTRNRMGPNAFVDDLTISSHTVESVDSGNLTDIAENTAQNPSSSNLSYKMRMKRYEKKMERAKAFETDASERPPPPPPPKRPKKAKTPAKDEPKKVKTPAKEEQHVSTSAYLSRFKGKGKVRAVPFEAKAKDPDGGTLESSNSSNPTDYSMKGSRFQSRVVSQSSSGDSESDDLPLLDAKGVPGSRSARRSMRFKTPAPTPERKPSTVNAAAPRRVKQNQQETAFAYPVLVRTPLQKEAKPRSILRKPKLGVPVAAVERKSSSPFDIKKEKDPMHRAGLRLLAAAVIPIQAEMRRFLAKREALNRMWAIIVIQATVRKWLVLKRRDVEDTAALVIQTAFADYLTREYARVLIQAHVRRWLVEKRILEVYAAVLIQAQVRGWMVHTEYIEFKSVIRIQAAVRCWLIRTEYDEFMAARQIQRVVRGNVARNEFTIQRSAVRIQKAARGWIAYRDFWQKVLSAVQIQAIFRGWLARDYLEDQQYCATQIQRVFRGYTATMSVYEDIYKVTLIQSFMRMRIAVDKATFRLAFIIQMQSIVRSYLVRKRLLMLNGTATVIQRHWRGFSSRLNYQFDLIDIILVQSAFRRRAARKRLDELKHDREVKCATVIQASWRSYDCRMNYLHYCADILILQSLSRRWLGTRQVEVVRRDTHYQASSKMQACGRGFLVRHRNRQHEAATDIQKAWRGFVSYAEYMYTIADIVIAQTFARCWLARRKHRALSHNRDVQAATKIQSQWRCRSVQTDFKEELGRVIICQSVARRLLARMLYLRKLLEEYSAEVIQRSFGAYLVRRDEHKAATCIQQRTRGISQRKKYAVVVKEHNSATKIQAAWRSFWQFSNFIIALDSTILLQSVARSFLVRSDLEYQANSAIAIQSMVRSVTARRVASAKSMVSAINSSGSAFGEREVDSAKMIQLNYRGYFARDALFRHRKARDIQSVWRSVLPRRALKQYSASLRIQTWWRFISNHIVYRQYTCSRRIQKTWRGHKAFTDYKYYTAARTIQTAHRKGRDQLTFRRYKSAKTIQAQFRCYSAREKFVQYLVTVEAATMIQSAWRSFVCYTDYIFTYSDIVVVQRLVRGYVQRHRYAAMLEEKAREEEHQRLRELCAIDIQRMHRGSVERDHYKRTRGAMGVQRVFRGHMARVETKYIQQYLAEDMRREKAAVIIQNGYRGYDQRNRYWYVLLCTIQIQCLARGYLQRLRFIDDVGGVIMAQAIVRRYFAIQKSRRQRELISLRAACIERTLLETQAAKIIQAFYRDSVNEGRQTDAAIKVQSFFRMVRAMVKKEIKKEKRRRKKRKDSKWSQRSTEFDEALLEDAWDALSFSVSASSIRESQIAKAAAASQEARKESISRASSAPRQGRQDSSSSRDTTKVRSKSRDSGTKKDAASSPAAESPKTAASKKMMPPSYLTEEDSLTTMSDKPAEMVRLGRKVVDDSDAMSEVSGLTTPSVLRPPPSRLERMGKKALTEDLDLEEAWVDMEIHNVKQKRRTTAKGRRHMKPRPPTTGLESPTGKRQPLGTDSPRGRRKETR